MKLPDPKPPAWYHAALSVVEANAPGMLDTADNLTSIGVPSSPLAGPFAILSVPGARLLVEMWKTASPMGGLLIQDFSLLQALNCAQYLVQRGKLKLPTEEEEVPK